MRSRNGEQGIFDGGSRRSLRKYELFTSIFISRLGMTNVQNRKI